MNLAPWQQSIASINVKELESVLGLTVIIPMINVSKAEGKKPKNVVEKEQEKKMESSSEAGNTKSNMKVHEGV